MRFKIPLKLCHQKNTRRRERTASIDIQKKPLTFRSVLRQSVRLSGMAPVSWEAEGRRFFHFPQRGREERIDGDGEGTRGSASSSELGTLDNTYAFQRGRRRGDGA